MSVHLKVRPLYNRIIDAAEELNVTIIIEKMYIIDRVTGQTTSTEIKQYWDGKSEKRGDY